MGSTTEQQFTENMEQLSGANYQQPTLSLCDNFIDKADQQAHDKAQVTYKQAEDTLVQEQGRMLRMGNIDISQISSNGAFAMAAQKRGDDLVKENKKKANADAVLMALLDQIRDDIERLDGEIADIRTDLDNKYGTNWEEHAAHEILDEVPAREPGESDDEYHSRLEELFKDEMVDPVTGKLKDEYRDHPNQLIRDIAELVDKELERNRGHHAAKVIQDPNATKEELALAEKLFSNPEEVEAATFAAASLPQNSDNQIRVENTFDKGLDQQANKEVTTAQVGFMDSGWGNS